MESNPLQVELQVVVSHLMGVLGSKPSSSAREAVVLDH